VSAWITREGVNDLLAGHGFTGEVDCLSIDIDGMDFWIWDALTMVDPLLVVAEFNALFGPVLPVAVAYQEDFDRHQHRERGIPKGYYGASIAALSAFAGRRGYRLVASCGSNGFFLKEGLCPELPTLTPEEAWEPDWKRPRLYERIRRMGVERYFAEAGWPLVNVGG
jgi:hypothetical protein